MFGWRRTVAASASRRKRCARSASARTSGRSSLTATGRSVRSSIARWIVAIPPRPMTRTEPIAPGDQHAFGERGGGGAGSRGSVTGGR